MKSTRKLPVGTRLKNQMRLHEAKAEARVIGKRGRRAAKRGRATSEDCEGERRGAKRGRATGNDGPCQFAPLRPKPSKRRAHRPPMRKIEKRDPASWIPFASE